MSTTNAGYRDRTAYIRQRLNALPDEDRQYIAAMRETAAEEDRVYAMNLAAVREAGHLTQTDIARRLGKAQANVSRTERSPDMLYSTLLSYLQAAGAQDVAITATVAGHRVEITLEAASR